ncbi:MAG: hypothetical protein RIE86_09910 [Imperialibacter sp.]|uniref:hypothetical protein n=1 Tax=Imperialibacter sp. TaxID=2038411 RepID=UPI0032EDA78E
MKSLLSLVFVGYFIVGSVLPRSNFKELEKVPSMLAHYEHHKNAFDKDLTFPEFLVLHFSLSSDHSEPSHETELPLHNGVVASFLFTIPQAPDLQASVQEYAVKHFKPFSINYQFQYTSNWFQPPQSA